MDIINLEKARVFARNHANARNSLIAWEDATRRAEWKTRQQVLNDFPRAKFISADRARFEISHNTFRLIAMIFYELQSVEIRFIGTHHEYDHINPKTV